MESEWFGMNAGGPQGILLDPVGFLFHINDFKTASDSTKYVDDSTLWESCSATGADSKLQAAADEAST